MTVTVKSISTGLVVPPSVRRQAGIKAGDRLEFKVSDGVITIAPVVTQTYKPTKSELAAIRKGETELARAESVSLNELLDDVDSSRRKVGAKTARKVSR
jgi:bifunctional DNA-binding transcriptional regulator/antitoxin component of YhaV-PrlF toxin-antitoxin module